MPSNQPTVREGGWIEVPVQSRPKARLFGLLALVWLGVVGLVSLPFWTADWQSKLAGKFSDANWICILLAIPEIVLLVLAVQYYFTETPVERIHLRRDPNYVQRQRS